MTIYAGIAPAGTVAVMVELLSTVHAAASTPPNETPTIEWKSPLIVTTVPAGPPLGVALKIVGVEPTKNVAALATEPPLASTKRGPVVAVAGTVRRRCWPSTTTKDALVPLTAT